MRPKMWSVTTLFLARTSAHLCLKHWTGLSLIYSGGEAEFTLTHTVHGPAPPNSPNSPNGITDSEAEMMEENLLLRTRDKHKHSLVKCWNTNLIKYKPKTWRKSWTSHPVNRTGYIYAKFLIFNPFSNPWENCSQSAVTFSSKIMQLKTFSRGLELIIARRQSWLKSLITFS